MFSLIFGLLRQSGTIHEGDFSFVKITLWPLLAISVALLWFTRPKTTEPLSDAFKRHRLVYLSIWYVGVAADWLQGPYVYALYQSYGWSSSEIATLFVAGFGSSMVFGTFVGALADRWGRKRCVVLYCVSYALACVTKHFNVFWVLLLGRILGGIATSLLFSAFECWMVAEHNERHKFGVPLLRYMFGCMYQGMYGVAIITGLVAEALCNAAPMWKFGSIGGAGLFVGGYTIPFDASGALCVLIIPPVCLLWDENYGDTTDSASILNNLRDAGVVLYTQPKVILLGLVVALFEASMYAFVFNWTPSLEVNGAAPPLGLVFSMFMMACVCGSSVFSLSNPNIDPTAVLLPNLLVAAAAMLVIAVCISTGAGQSMSACCAIFFMCLLFEYNVGVYFPAIGTLKSSIVPEATRASIYNLYRVPLNALVCALLLNSLTTWKCFAICFGVLCGGAILVAIIRLMPSTAEKEKGMKDDVEGAAEKILTSAEGNEKNKDYGACADKQTAVSG